MPDQPEGVMSNRLGSTQCGARGASQEVDALLDSMLPRSKDGKLPSVMDLNIFGCSSNPDLQELCDNCITILSAESERIFGESFSRLKASDRANLLDNLQKRNVPSFRALSEIVVKFYYKNPRVMQALNIDNKPPFPDGKALEPDDWLILEPVFRRGPIYRD